jgi:hypothetical protein
MPCELANANTISGAGVQSSRRVFLKGTGGAVLAAAPGNTTAAAPAESAKAQGPRVHVIQTGHVKVKKALIGGCGDGPARQLGPILDTHWS